jgi:hypothetical protein
MYDVTKTSHVDSEVKKSDSSEFSGGAHYCSSKSSRGKDLKIQEPILRGDFATFHFDPTLACVQGPALIWDQVVQVRQPGQKRLLAPFGMMKALHHE